MSVAIAPVIRPGQAMPRGVVAWNIVEMKFAESGVSEEDWEHAFRICARYVGAAAWWIGDALVKGEDFHVEGRHEYERAIEITGLAETTLKQYKHVASRFPKERRRAGLSWSHHLEVASLALGLQETWLNRAEAEGLSQKDLREQLAGLGAQTPLTLVPVTLSKITRDEVDRWKAAAESAGMDLREWLRRLANQAVGVNTRTEDAA